MSCSVLSCHRSLSTEDLKLACTFVPKALLTPDDNGRIDWSKIVECIKSPAFTARYPMVSKINTDRRQATREAFLERDLNITSRYHPPSVEDETAIFAKMHDKWQKEKVSRITSASATQCYAPCAGSSS